MGSVMKVYLAGRMAGRMGIDVINERECAVNACLVYEITPIDPAAGEDVHPGKLVDTAMDYALMKSYVDKDEYAVRNCDAMIVLTGDTPSEGTGQEIALAHFLHKPIVMVAPKRRRGELVGFWNIKASKLVDTVGEAAEYLAENYNLGDY